MAYAAVHSKAVIMLLLLLMMMIVAPIVGFSVCSIFCCTLLCILSSFAIILMGKRLLYLFVFLMSCFCYCSVAFPHGAMGWSALCDCGSS